MGMDMAIAEVMATGMDVVMVIIRKILRRITSP